ncbi:MAG: heavy metal translocating P-type ATPase [Synechococcales bacterium]|nr:heavy metal translocating P-type ATPase [Synechococcales bacterium]
MTQTTPKPSTTPETRRDRPAPVLQSPPPLTLHVGGMKCAGCVRAVETQIQQQPGVKSAVVNLVTEKATVEYDPEQANRADLAQAIADRLGQIGFSTDAVFSPATSDQQGEAIAPAALRQGESSSSTRPLAIATVLLGLSLIGHLKQFGWLTVPVISNIWFHSGLATLALIGPGRSILVDGWRGLRHNVPNMNTLVGLGMTTAYVTSMIALLFPRLGWDCFFDEPVMLVGFILLGRTLEQQARSQAAAALESLLSLKPTTARVLNASTAPLNFDAGETLSVDQVHPGQLIGVLPGEKIPVDGDIVQGRTTVNEAMLTGESMPVAKGVGDRVSAGSINQSGAIALTAARIGENTTLAQIINLVETAQTRKAPIQRLADTVAGYFTYGVMAIALVTFLFWYFVGTALFPEVLTLAAHPAHHATMAPGLEHLATPQTTSPLLLSLKLAIAVLVIACPCALGLATPTAILVGSGVGAERGLLIRGGDVLERACQIDTLVFDKTGTLTTGSPVVTDYRSLMDTVSPEDVLRWAAAVESGTRHPIAAAIRHAATEQALELPPAQDFQTEAGLGVMAQVGGRQMLLGTQSWLNQHQVAIAPQIQAEAQALTAQGKTPVYLAVSGTLAGLIAVQDSIREDAPATIAQLRQMGLRVVMMTGDQARVARAIAEPLGLPSADVFSEVRPDAKANAVEVLQAQGHRVAMVGDGINDAPALAQADVGISLHSGTDVAVETAEIVLMRDRLVDVVESIRLSRRVFGKIRQNLFWAFAYNIVGIPVAAGVLLPLFGVLLSPAAAGALMAFSSVSVVTNSLLLRRAS